MPGTRDAKKNPLRDWTAERWAGEDGVLGNNLHWTRRRDELLAKLAARSKSCPGLYPFREPGEFLRIARDHAGGLPEDLCRVLEAMWLRPEEAVQLNAQSLIRRGKGWVEGSTPAGENGLNSAREGKPRENKRN